MRDFTNGTLPENPKCNLYEAAACVGERMQKALGLQPRAFEIRFDRNGILLSRVAAAAFLARIVSVMAVTFATAP